MPEIIDARDHTASSQLITNGLDPNKLTICLEANSGEQLMFEANLEDDPMKTVESNVAAMFAWYQKKLDEANAEHLKKLEEANAETERLRLKDADESVRLGKRKRLEYDAYRTSSDRTTTDDSSKSNIASDVPSSPPSMTMSQSGESSNASSSPPPSSSTEMSDHESVKIKIEPNMHKNAFNRLMENASRKERANHADAAGWADAVDLTKDDTGYVSNADRYVLQTKRHGGKWIGDDEVTIGYLKGLYGCEGTLNNNEGLKEAIEWRFRRDGVKWKRAPGPRKATYIGSRVPGRGMSQSKWAPRY